MEGMSLLADDEKEAANSIETCPYQKGGRQSGEDGARCGRISRHVAKVFRQ